MANDQQTGVPISFFTIVIKRPEEPGRLEARSYMSMQDAELEMAELEQEGLELGRDYALADMMQGAIAPCPGIAFRNVGGGFLPSWVAVASC